MKLTREFSAPTRRDGLLGAGLAAIAGTATFSHQASAQSTGQQPGVPLQGAQHQVLNNGNALVNFQGKQFAVPNGMYADVNGVLYIAQQYAQSQGITIAPAVPAPLSSAPSAQAALPAQLVTLGDALPTASGAAISVNYPSQHQTGTYDALAPFTGFGGTTAGGGLGQLLPVSYGGWGLGGGFTTLLMVGGVAALAYFAWDAFNDDDDDGNADQTDVRIEFDDDAATTVTHDHLDNNTDADGQEILDVNGLLADGFDAGDVKSYTISGDAAAFLSIDENGKITLTEAIPDDLADTYGATITVTSTSGHESSIDLEFDVADALAPEFDTEPEIVTPDHANSDEKIVTIVSANDETTADAAITFALLNADGAQVTQLDGFRIDPSTGKIFFDATHADAVGVQDDYTLEVVAIDEAGNVSDPQILTMDILDNSGVEAKVTLDIDQIYSAFNSGNPLSLKADYAWFTFAMDKDAFATGSSSDALALIINTEMATGTDEALITLAYDDALDFFGANGSVTAGADLVSDAFQTSNSYASDTPSFAYFEFDSTSDAYVAAVLTDQAGSDILWTETTSALPSPAPEFSSLTLDLDGQGPLDLISYANDIFSVTLDDGSGPATETFASPIANVQYFDFGDADNDGDLDEVLIMSGGELNSYHLGIALNNHQLELKIEEEVTSLSGLDLDDLADGTFGDGNSGDAQSFLWMDGTAADGGDQILVSSSTMSYIYDLSDILA